MADLDYPMALSLAWSLSTIGHPRAQAAIDATALDLINWCKGAILDGRQWSAEEQAHWLCHEVRYGDNAWRNWEAAGGTAALYAIFIAKFPPKAKVESGPVTPEEAIEKGLILRPCEICDDRLYLGRPPNMQYCTACAQGRQNARWNGEEALHRLNLDCSKPKPVPTITADQIARAQADEVRRKREQLKKLELD